MYEYVKVYNICQRRNTTAFRKIQHLREYDFNNTIEIRKETMRNSTKTKTMTYMNINPTLAIHEMYTSKKYIPDYMRIEMTRFRVGSHRLKIETGRWARTPPELRICACGSNEIQDEKHVIHRCGYTEEIRVKHGITNNDKPINEVLGDGGNIRFIYEIMKKFCSHDPH